MDKKQGEIMERHLATVQVIKSVEPIQGKDRIGYISFRNVAWRVIGERTLQFGDKVIYIEYDSILPEFPAFEFLRKRCWSARWQGFKIGCMKMFNLVSYGLLLTWESVRDIIPADVWENYQEGDDLTELLHVRKVDDDEVAISTKARPPFIPKTDETRAEVLPFLFDEKWQGLPVYCTVKVDGQNANFSLYNGRFQIASRNSLLYDEELAKAKEELVPDNTLRFRSMSIFHAMACKYDIPRKMEAYGLVNCVMQCEQAGPNIQGNKMRLADNELFIFNLFDIAEQRYRSWQAIEQFSQSAGIPTVPFIEETRFHWKTIDELYEYSRGIYPNGHAREGVVIRAVGDGKYLPLPERGMANAFSFKIINPDYLLKN
jgi:RNA ligase (TIGR02306 family)